MNGPGLPWALDTRYEAGALAQANTPKRPHVCLRAASGEDARAWSHVPVVTGAMATTPASASQGWLSQPWGPFRHWSLSFPVLGLHRPRSELRTRNRSFPGTASHPHTLSAPFLPSLEDGVSP